MRFGRTAFSPGASGIADGVTTGSDGLFDRSPALFQGRGQRGIPSGRTHRDDGTKGNGGRCEVPTKGFPTSARLLLRHGAEKSKRQVQILLMKKTNAVGRGGGRREPAFWVDGDSDEPIGRKACRHPIIET